MIVHKFGGTSVGNAACFANVAEIVVQQVGPAGSSDSIEMAVVVSAMHGVTDQLITGARAAAEGKDNVYREIRAGLLSRHLDVVETLLTTGPERLGAGEQIEDQLHELGRFYRSIAMLGECTARGLDAVASCGALLAATILAAVLRERGIRAQAVPAAGLIVTDARFGAATPLLEPTRRRLQDQMLPLVQRGILPVITGYGGATPDGIATTLGRGGGDLAAALVGVGLDAQEVWIWSDVNGILTADPHLVPEARTLSELSYSEAADLAYYGAEVLHPRTIQPVRESRIPLRILNSFHPTHPGTRIVDTPSVHRRRLPAIISTAGLSLIAIGSRDEAWALPLSARALQRLAEAGVEVLMFSQSFSEHSLNLVLREQDLGHCLRALAREFHCDQPGASFRLETNQRVATISVVGVPNWCGNGIVSRAFAALGKLGTRVISVAQAASQYSVSFCIPADEAGDTVRFLHRELGLEGPSPAELPSPCTLCAALSSEHEGCARPDPV